MTTVVTRFAPSPTGYLHLGGVRTALYNWLWARKNGGQYLLRVEDTDESRNMIEATQAIFDGFDWLGLGYDGEVVHQAQRRALYEEKLQELWNAGKIYPAFETEDELHAARAEAEAAKRTYVYNGSSVQLGRDEAEAKMQAGEPFLWRLIVNPIDITRIKETLMGSSSLSGYSDKDGNFTTTQFQENYIDFQNNEIGDFPLTRMGNHNAPGMPLYNFCNVVDDHDQGVTHIIRGAEHLSNAARQALLYRAFGWAEPTFTHLPLILKNGKKMSKRDSDPRFAVAVHERQAQGYLPETLLNYIALLGWSPGDDREFMSLDEMIELFTLDRLSKSNANFDEDKFLHFNGLWIRHLDPIELAQRVAPFMDDAFPALPAERQQALVKLVVERAKLLTDFAELLAHFSHFDGDFKDEKTAQLFTPETGTRLQQIAAILKAADDFTTSALEAMVKDWAATNSLKPKDYMMPLRLSLTGSSHSAGGVFEIAALLGREETLARLDKAIGFIQRPNA